VTFFDTGTCTTGAERDRHRTPAGRFSPSRDYVRRQSLLPMATARTIAGCPVTHLSPPSSLAHPAGRLCRPLQFTAGTTNYRGDHDRLASGLVGSARYVGASSMTPAVAKAQQSRPPASLDAEPLQPGLSEEEGNDPLCHDQGSGHPVQPLLATVPGPQRPGKSRSGTIRWPTTCTDDSDNDLSTPCEKSPPTWWPPASRPAGCSASRRDRRRRRATKRAHRGRARAVDLTLTTDEVQHSRRRTGRTVFRSRLTQPIG